MRASSPLAASVLVAAAVLLRAGAASAEEAKEEPRPALTWKDGRTTLELGNAQINVTSRIQIRFTDGPAGGGRVGAFRLRRARTSLDGWLYRRELEFELMVDWVDDPLLEDLNLNWDVSRRRALQVKVGQFKVPFGRQELTSDTGQQFVDRSIVSAEFAKGRDQGVQAWGTLLGRRVEYRAGIFNGNGRGRATTNDDGAFQYDARLTVQPWGDVKYSEGDFESTDRPLVAAAVGWESNDPRPRAGTASATGAPRRDLQSADLVVKYRGASLMGEYFRRRITPVGGAAFRSDGFHAQAGLFLRPRVLELAARWASWDPSAARADDHRIERGLALSYFVNRHAFKVQADARRVEDRARGTADDELRAQIQFLF